MIDGSAGHSGIIVRMNDLVKCACGRVWQVEAHEAKFARRGTIKCRCHRTLLQDEEGTRDARLTDPREGAIGLRKSIGHAGLLLLKLGLGLGVPIWRWIKPNRIPVLLAPNKAVHVRLEHRVLTKGFHMDSH